MHMTTNGIIYFTCIVQNKRWRHILQVWCDVVFSAGAGAVYSMLYMNVNMFIYWYQKW